MSATLPTYNLPPMPTGLPNGNPNTAMAFRTQAYPLPASPAAAGLTRGLPQQAPFGHAPSITEPERLKALAKSFAYLAPAIALARVSSNKAPIRELLPSDWKVWAKMGLGVASVSQFNKAMNWNPPPWLGALMNITVMTGLMTGINRNSARVLTILGPSVAGLVQGTHCLSEKLEKPLEENYDIPPLATRLTLSLLSMGTGFFALPRLFETAQSWLPSFFKEEAKTTGASLAASKTNGLKQTPPAGQGKAPLGLTSNKTSQAKPAPVAPGSTAGRNGQNHSHAEKTALVIGQTCARGCCGSVICANEVADYTAVTAGWVQKTFIKPEERKNP